VLVRPEVRRLAFFAKTCTGKYRNKLKLLRKMSIPVHNHDVRRVMHSSSKGGMKEYKYCRVLARTMKTQRVNAWSEMLTSTSSSFTNMSKNIYKTNHDNGCNKKPENVDGDALQMRDGGVGCNSLRRTLAFTTRDT
jgi:hypothetical protein